MKSVAAKIILVMVALVIILTSCSGKDKALSSPLTAGRTEAVVAGSNAATTAEPVLEGEALVANRCNVCHGLDKLEGIKKDAAGWEAIVNRMIGHGAKLTAAEKAAVVAHLAAPK